MPISSNATYVPTMDDFLAHWASVNAAPDGGGELILKNGEILGDLRGQRLALLALQGEILSARNDAQIARAAIEQGKALLNAVLNKFNDTLDAYFSGLPLAAVRPLVPQLTAAQQDFTNPMRDALDVWRRINAVSPAPAGVTLPLTLPNPAGGRLDRAGFEALVNALTDAYATLRAAENSLKIRREERTGLHSAIRDLLKLYRQAVAARFLDNHPLVLALPRLSPPEGGRTPAPVAASAVLVPPDTAKIVHEASDDPDIKEYQLRGVPGSEWSAEDAVTIATHQPGDAREFITPFSLTQPGAAASFAVYVILDTGHEKGSAPMTVTRPLTPAEQ
ncbi:MAG: hypothetical protein V4726_25085 [Verrucomicrobiota bacterium]